MAKTAMFTGLVFDEQGNPAGVSSVGDDACYVVMDDDFRRHIDAEQVDRQVLHFMREQVEGHRDLAVKTMLDMMGKDDIFTKVALEASINRMEEAVGQPRRSAEVQCVEHRGLDEEVFDHPGEGKTVPHRTVDAPNDRQPRQPFFLGDLDDRIGLERLPELLRTKLQQALLVEVRELLTEPR